MVIEYHHVARTGSSFPANPQGCIDDVFIVGLSLKIAQAVVLAWTTAAVTSGYVVGECHHATIRNGLEKSNVIRLYISRVLITSSLQ